MPAKPEICETCPFDGQIRALEEWRREMEKARVDDIREVSDKLGEVHEKVNAFGLKLAKLDGKIIGAVLASTAAASVVAWLLRHS